MLEMFIIIIWVSDSNIYLKDRIESVIRIFNFEWDLVYYWYLNIVNSIYI